MSARAGLIGLVAGLLVWSSAFVALYGLHAVGCGLGWHEPGQFLSLLRLVLVAVWVVHLAALAWLVAWYHRAAPGPERGKAFLRLAAWTLALVGLGATLWTGAPVALLELCV
jgi:hypothetical protein